MEETKKWLGRGRLLDVRIKNLIKEKENTYNLLTNGTSHISDEIRGSGAGKDVLMIKYLEYAARLENLIDKLLATKQEIITAISMVEDGRLNTLLELRYINFYTFEKIAEELGYSEYWTRSILHDRALGEVKKAVLRMKDTIGAEYEI